VKKPVICLFLLMSLVGCSIREPFTPAQCTPIPNADAAGDSATTTSTLTYCRCSLIAAAGRYRKSE
jgi:hypothetical protein